MHVNVVEVNAKHPLPSPLRPRSGAPRQPGKAGKTALSPARDDIDGLPRTTNRTLQTFTSFRHIHPRPECSDTGAERMHTWVTSVNRVRITLGRAFSLATLVLSVFALIVALKLVSPVVP